MRNFYWIYSDDGNFEAYTFTSDTAAIAYGQLRPTIVRVETNDGRVIYEAGLTSSKAPLIVLAIAIVSIMLIIGGGTVLFARWYFGVP